MKGGLGNLFIGVTPTQQGAVTGTTALRILEISANGAFGDLGVVAALLVGRQAAGRVDVGSRELLAGWGLVRGRLKLRSKPALRHTASVHSHLHLPVPNANGAFGGLGALAVGAVDQGDSEGGIVC